MRTLHTLNPRAPRTRTLVLPSSAGGLRHASQVKSDAYQQPTGFAARCIPMSWRHLEPSSSRYGADDLNGPSHMSIQPEVGMDNRGSVGAIAYLLASLMSPTGAAAQDAGIAGSVRDPSGAAVPGVSVEASSPALIEKTRSAVTDDQGRYQIGKLE